MKTSSLNLLPATTFGSAVGNYDGTATTFSGEPVKAAAYYTKDKGAQTASWSLIGFVGVLTIEATLDADNTTSNYTAVHTINAVTPLTENDYANLPGNFTWLRATATDFTAGTISQAAVGY